MELIYYEEFSTKKEAKAREKQIKSWKGGEPFKNLLEGSPRLRRDLSRWKREIPPSPQG